MPSKQRKQRAFKTMTPAQKRVRIAEDALAWIEAGALIPTNGVYVRPEKAPPEKIAGLLDEQARDVVLGKCEVCALGALMVAKAVDFDDTTVRDLLLSTGSYRSNTLAGYFSPEALVEIEFAFEGVTWARHGGRPWAGLAVLWASPKARLVAILRNIVRNKGDFDPNEV